MTRKNMPKFEDWEAEKIKDPDFLAAAEELAPATRLPGSAC